VRIGTLSLFALAACGINTGTLFGSGASSGGGSGSAASTGAGSAGAGGAMVDAGKGGGEPFDAGGGGGTDAADHDAAGGSPVGAAGAVNSTASVGTGGTTGAGGGAACAHTICAAGGPLSAACEPCVTIICAEYPECCTDEWDVACVGRVATFCGDAGIGTGFGLCSTSPNDGTCAHSVCATGAALAGGADDACSPCAYSVCQGLPYCCGDDGGTWDVACVDYVPLICQFTCGT
jgi:hypothetical protein